MSIIKGNKAKGTVKPFCLFYLFIASSFALVALGAMVCHAVYHLAQTTLLAKCHCSKSYLSDSKTLASGTPRASLCSPQVFCCCSKSQRSCGYDSAGLVTLQIPEGRRSGKYWCGQTQISASVPHRRMQCFVCFCFCFVGFFFISLKFLCF